VAPQRDEIFKQKVNDCVQHIILQKYTMEFQNICNGMVAPFLLRHPVYHRLNVRSDTICGLHCCIVNSFIQEFGRT